MKTQKLTFQENNNKVKLYKMYKYEVLLHLI